MASIQINDVDQRVQYTATAGQTVFPVPFVFLADADIVVYHTVFSTGITTKLVLTTNYTLSGAGAASGGTMTLVVGAAVNDVITILGETAIDRTTIYSPVISALTGDDLNTDANREIIISKQLETTQDLLQLQYAPYAEVSQSVSVTRDRWLPRLDPEETWQMNAAGTEIVAVAAPPVSLGMTANITTDNVLLKTDLPAGINILQETGITISDTNDVTGVADLTAQNITLTTDTISVSGPLSITSTGATTIDPGGALNLNPTGNLNLYSVIWPTSAPTAGQGLKATSPTVLDWTTYVEFASLPVVASKIVVTSGTGGTIDDTDVTVVGGDITAVTSLTVDNLTIDGNAITADNVNGEVNLVPNGTGSVQVNGADFATESGGTVTLTNTAFDANGTGNSLTNVDVADLSNGTAGALISWTAGSAPTTIAPGTSGFVLTSNGAGAEPTWQASSGGGPIEFKASVVAASTAAYSATYDNGTAGVGATLTNSGALAAFEIDGYNPSASDRVLIKNQGTAAHNGIYEVTTVGDGATAWVLTRTTDFDEPAEMTAGSLVPVDNNGDTNALTSWLLEADVTTVGTSGVTFVQFTYGYTFPQLIAGDPGNEGTGINIGGTTYDAALKVSDLGGTNQAQFILHRHSTTLPPLIVGSRSNSNDETHTLVADGQELLTLIGVGWDGTNYELGARIDMEVDGTPGANDMPGRIIFSVTPDGSATPAEAMRISQDRTTLVSGTLDIDHTATTSDDHAFEIDVNADGNADVKGIDIVYTTGAQAAATEETAILVNIDESSAVGGEVAGIEVLTTTEGGGDVYGYIAGVGVNPLAHLSGTFGNVNSALVNAVDRTTEFNTSGSNVTLFVADNDTVTIGGGGSKFEEIEFILATTASNNIQPTFEYSTGVGTWATFSPTDGTNGFQNTGIIAWLDSDIPSWAVGTGAEYLIRITRTRNNLPTSPVEDLVQISAATQYSWDKNADVNINSLSFNGNSVITESGGTATLTNTSFDANGTGNSLSNVDVADLANGTDGALISWNSSGVATTIAPGTSGHVLTSNGPGAEPTYQAAGGGGSSESVTRDITQVAHGFAVGDWVRLNGTDTYTDAQADSAANAEVVGVVSAVAGVDDFTLQVSGYVTGLTGLTANTVYFLDPSTAGAITSTEPSTTGEVIKPCLVSATTTSGYILTYRGNVISASGGSGKILQVVQGTLTSSTTITSATLTDTGLTATITPSSTSSKILVMVTMSWTGAGTNQLGTVASLLRGSTEIFVGDAAGSRNRATAGLPPSNAGGTTSSQDVFAVNYLDSPSTTSATTYKVQVADKLTTTSTIAINRSSLDTNTAGYTRSVSSIILMEVEG